MKRPFLCKKAGCNKSYTTRFSLRRHLTSHQEVKQHVCVLCFKSFTLAQYLKEHTYIHTGQKPFQCDFPGCDKAFRQAGKLSLHRKFHQNIIFSVQHTRKREAALKSLEVTKKFIARLKMSEKPDGPFLAHEKSEDKNLHSKTDEPHSHAGQTTKLTKVRSP